MRKPDREATVSDTSELPLEDVKKLKTYLTALNSAVARRLVKNRTLSKAWANRSFDSKDEKSSDS